MKTCMGCGEPIDATPGGVWEESVNLTPDLLVIGQFHHFHGHDIVEADIAFDWCSLVCFCRWLYRAAAYMPHPEARS